MSAPNATATMRDPWMLTAEYLDEAERALLPTLADDVVSIMRPILRPEHQGIVEEIARLGWSEDRIEQAVHNAFSLLVDNTVPGGLIDPEDDAADIPWCSMLRRMIRVPVLGSKKARQWFTLLQRFRWNDVPVSTITEGTACYAAALMEHLRRRHSEASYWMRSGAVQNEDDERPGLGVAVVIRAARLLTANEAMP